MSSSLALREAQTIAGKYRLLSMAGRGGFGEVWKARDIELDRDVALKFLLKFPHSPERARHALEEPKMLGRLTSDGSLRGANNIVRINDVKSGDDGIPPFLDLEWVGGGNLQQRLTRGGPMAYDEILALAHQLTNALICAHSYDVVHCDIKPSNVLVSLKGRQYKLSDFGLARHLSAATGASWGTPQYMSPEQFRAPDTIGPQTDVYSLGVLLFQCAEGRLPYSATDWDGFERAHCRKDTPSIRSSDVSDGFRELVRESMSKRPERRPEPTAIRLRLKGLAPSRPSVLDVSVRASGLRQFRDGRFVTVVHSDTDLRFLRSASGVYVPSRLVTNRDYRTFLSDARNDAWRTERVALLDHDGGYLEHWSLGEPLERERDHPIHSVPYDAANAFAEWIGGRLPSAAEIESELLGDSVSPLRRSVEEYRSAFGLKVVQFWCGEGYDAADESLRAVWRYLPDSPLAPQISRCLRPKHMCLPHCVCAVVLPSAVAQSVLESAQGSEAPEGASFDGESVVESDSL